MTASINFHHFSLVANYLSLSDLYQFSLTCKGNLQFLEGREIWLFYLKKDFPFNFKYTESTSVLKTLYKTLKLTQTHCLWLENIGTRNEPRIKISIQKRPQDILKIEFFVKSNSYKLTTFLGNKYANLETLKNKEEPPPPVKKSLENLSDFQTFNINYMMIPDPEFLQYFIGETGSIFCDMFKENLVKINHNLPNAKFQKLERFQAIAFIGLTEEGEPYALKHLKKSINATSFIFEGDPEPFSDFYIPIFPHSFIFFLSQKGNVYYTSYDFPNKKFSTLAKLNLTGVIQIETLTEKGAIGLLNDQGRLFSLTLNSPFEITEVTSEDQGDLYLHIFGCDRFGEVFSLKMNKERETNLEEVLKFEQILEIST